MAGLYFHIPFCRRACVYCDFHFSTALDGRERVLAAMRTELERRKAEWDTSPVDNLYFGGGTPSLLAPEEIKGLLDEVHRHGEVAATAEITLEANPDDVTPAALEAWLALGITRISLGTQSFRDERLRWMGRAHDAAQALRSIDLIAKAGFTSWTIDLIYGLPGMTLAEWDEQLTIALEHGMPHLSAYCLTVEPRTALHHQVQKGRVLPADDAQQAEQFEHLVRRMGGAGLVQYEISNFGRPGHFAQHNTSYWKGAPYMGIGPSAHSFDGKVRRWNVANNLRYAQGVEHNGTHWEHEVLTTAQRANEMLLTGLRTMWGVDTALLGLELPAESRAEAERYVAEGLLQWRDTHLVLTARGKNFADRIASDLFILEP
ncbi:MAG TPA: radical SAM family heme chaperone HemW [Flavobacteriales bacterium]